MREEFEANLHGVLKGFEDLLVMRAEEEEKRSKRRERVLEVMRTLDQNQALRKAIASPMISEHLTTFGIRGNGATLVCGIPLIGSTQDWEMLAFTDKGVEWLQADNGPLQEVHDFQAHNIVDHEQWCREQKTNPDESKLIKSFFEGNIGGMDPQDFEAAVVASLEKFMDVLNTPRKGD